MPTSSSSELPEILKAAKWIWPDSPHWDLHNCYALFRYTFELELVPAEAPLHITADQSYQLYVNGNYICRGPARGYQHRWPYDTVDLSPYLQTGNNLIAIRAHNPGFSNFQYVHQGFAGLLVAAEWGSTRILTDVSWKSRRQSGLERDMVPTSLQLFSEENIDLRQEAPDWMHPDYDDSAWNAPFEPQAFGCLPWYELEARGIPMLEEIYLPHGQVLGTAAGANHPDYLSTRNLSRNKFEEGLDHLPCPIETAETVNFESSAAENWQSVLIDMGKTYVGSVELEIEGAMGGEIIETHHYETIDTKRLCPDYVPEAHCRMAFSNRLICRSGTQCHMFYHPFGFRHMVLLVRNNSRPLTIRPRLRSTVYPHDIKGQFESSETDLNAIWETCAWTERVCSMDAYVDTPWREQAQWWGDARVQAWNTFHLSGDARLFKRGIDQIAEQSTCDGITYGHAPTMAHTCVLPDFTLIWMLTFWDYYWQTGSLDLFQQHQNSIQRALDYFERWTNAETGLLNYDHRYWLFLDWTDLHKEGCSSIYSLWYLHALDRLSQLYKLIGNHSASHSCSEKAKRLRTQLQKLINDEGLMQGGYTERGEIVSETSVHAQTLALLTELAPQHETAMLEKRMLPYLRGEFKTEIQPSAYWITYVYSVLSERGYGDEIVADIRKRWVPMVDYGTTWENFDPTKGVESFSHAWSAHPLFHLMQIIGGVRQQTKAWDTIHFRPSFIGQSADITIPSPKGLIHSSWQRSGNQITGQLKIPQGMQANVDLNGIQRIESKLYSYVITYE
jgi:hypothetical protein